MARSSRVVVITGMSGAGRSVTAKVLQDVGYFVVDNLPPQLIPAVVNQRHLTDGPNDRLGVVVDARSGLDFDELDEALLWLAGQGIWATVLFLDASDEALVRRFEEVRRPHPVEADTLEQSIEMERKALEELRGQSDIIIDSSRLSVHELRERLEDAFSGTEPRRRMQIDVTSFGFKYGNPRVVDVMFDVRFLPNPHWIAELRPQTGLDEPVRDYVMEQPEAGEFLSRITELLAFLIPRYEAEGKSYLTIAVGCTGGKHRSVAMTEEIGRFLKGEGVDVRTHHRDLPGGDAS
ncbi:MAG: RNase adapter RapZ [Acidimicrobiia bacterium]|nr:RNase adapter RapZ [Acidimicrobiia bacterium]NNC76109.1 RNase adapter RapZ [Acidimicrobiia bacterium]